MQHLQQAADELVQEKSTKPNLELAVIGIGALVVSLSQSLLVPVLGVLPAELDTSTGTVSWLLTSTLLVGAVSVPIFGRLADMFGKRLLLLVAVGALTVGSLLTAVTDNIPLLILGRAIQGASLAAVPLGISILAVRMPRERAGSAIALVSAMLGVGGALGLPLAGLVAEHASFHALFWITAIAGLISFIGIALFIPETGARPGGRIDLVGSVLLAGGLVCLLLPLSEASDWGWGSMKVWGLLAVAAVLLVAFGFSQLRISEPLVDMKALRSTPIVLTNLTSILFGFALYASLIGTASFVEAPEATGYGFGSSLIVGGLALLPSGLAMLLFSPVAAKLIERWGASRTLALGALVVGVGWALRIVASGSLFQVILGTTIVGIGTGIGYAAIPTLINVHTPPSEIASANGLNSLFRSLGSSLASAIGASILAASTVAVGAFEMPSIEAYRILFGVCAAVAVVAAAMALFIPHRAQPSDATLTRS